jgi:hypothetical protein
VKQIAVRGAVRVLALAGGVRQLRARRGDWERGTHSRQAVLDASVLTKVTHAIVKLGPDGHSERPWLGVRLPDGRAAFVSSTLARSPIDYRAYFKFADGTWRLTFFAAGD